MNFDTVKFQLGDVDKLIQKELSFRYMTIRDATNDTDRVLPDDPRYERAPIGRLIIVLKDVYQIDCGDDEK